MALLAVGGKSWGVRAGTYRLESTIVFESKKDVYLSLKKMALKISGLVN
jgi:hypothetical protein